MQGLFSDETEKKEEIINYLLQRQRLEDKRKNELILIDGEIEFYKNLKRVLRSEDSDRERKAEKFNAEQIRTQEYKYDNIEARGEGGVPFQAKQLDEKKLNEQRDAFNRDSKRANEILSDCTEKIKDLEMKYKEIENTQQY